MWSGLLSAALLCGVLSTTIVVAQGPESRISRAPDPTTLPPQFPIASGSPTGTGFSTNAPETDTSTLTSTSARALTSGLKGATGAASSNDKGTPGSPAESPAPTSKKNNTGAIAGGVVGGVVLLILVGALIFFLRKRKRTRDPLGSMEKTADERAANNESPSPPLPAPIATTSSSPHPHHSPTTPNEGHALMSHYGDAQPQHIPQEVQPVIMPGKPYDVNPSSREIHDGDEDLDGVSINSPSPVTTPSPERQQEQQRSVPRLPIYQGGRTDNTGGGNTPPPAL